MTFEEFAAAELDPLLRFAKVLCVDRGLAEDVVQEVLARAMARWAAIGELDQPRAYVRRMIVNEFLSWRRKWSRVSPVAALPETVTSGPAERVADRVQLVAELRKLPPRQRAVLVLRYYGRLSDTEIAADLGCSVGTVRSHISRGLAALRVEVGVGPALTRES